MQKENTLTDQAKLYRRLRNPQIASVIVCSKWDQMVYNTYNTVLTAEKRGPQIVGPQITGIYCIFFALSLYILTALKKQNPLVKAVTTKMIKKMNLNPPALL